MAELIAYAKANPTLLNYGSGSSVFMFITENFKSLAAIEMREIPYNGVPPMVSGLLAGDVQVGVVNLAPTLAHIKAGKLKALAVMDDAREPLLADVPTIAEAGVRGHDLAGLDRDVRAGGHAAGNRRARERRDRARDRRAGGAGKDAWRPG